MNEPEQIIADVWAAAKGFVQTRLLCPASAIFAEDGQTGPVVSLGEQTIEITSTVDAQNQYGAMLRQYWHLVMRQTPAGWRQIYCEISDHPILIRAKPTPAKCPHCHGQFIVDSILNQQKINCPACQKEFLYLRKGTMIFGCIAILVLLILLAFIVYYTMSR